MNDWGNDDVENQPDLVIFVPEKLYALTDDQEVNENADRLYDILPNDVARLIEIDTNCDFDSTSKLL